MFGESFPSTEGKLYKTPPPLKEKIFGKWVDFPKPSQLAPRVDGRSRFIAGFPWALRFSVATKVTKVSPG